MAISDFFSGGNTPDYLSGLLDDEQLRQLKANAQRNALLQFGLSALSNSGYSRTPVGIGEILGQAGMAGMQGYQQGVQSGIEGIGTRAKLEELKRKRDQQAQLDTMIGGITDPNEALLARLAPEQYVAARVKPKSSFNILTNEQAAAYQLPTDTGQRYQMTDKGVELISGTQTKPRATERVDAGNKILVVDSATGETIREIPKGLAPQAPTKASEPSYSIQTDINGKAIYVPNKPGMPSIDAATGKPTVYEPAPTAAQEKIKEKATKAATIPTLLNEAKKLIPQATGSKLGSIADEAAATFGESTTGAEKIASLKAIEAQLILNMPRLEGPQGVLDLMLYKEAAGQVGNPTIPAKTKLAALQTLQDINNRANATQPGNTTATAAPAPATPTATAIPKIGEVRGGYEFLGGNPNDKTRWRKK
jgi:hypothetical protein